MSTTVEQIEQWMSAPTETQILEFKEAKTQLDNTRLYKYCVAIANEGGGHLLLGITNDKPRRVVGSNAFNNPTAMASKLFTALGFRVDIEPVAHPDGRVVVFHIPSRPKGAAYAYEGAYLGRIGEELKPMSEDRLRTIFTEGQPDFIDLIAKNSCSEEDVVSLLDTPAYFDLIERPYPSARTEVLATFVKRRFVLQAGGNYGITNLGALLFARNLAFLSRLGEKGRPGDPLRWHHEIEGQGRQGRHGSQRLCLRL